MSVGYWFCIVPKLEGREFTELPDFPVRPILCDNNLSALSPEYQDHIVKRYLDEDVPLLDANSGFEPRTFTEDVYERWRVINKGYWRFAYDDAKDEPHVKRVMHMLRHLNYRKKRVYVLIGNEPVDACLDRIYKVIGWGGDPYVQPFIKLNALTKTPHVRFDWSRQLLRDVARWCNMAGPGSSQASMTIAAMSASATIAPTQINWRSPYDDRSLPLTIGR